MCKAKIKQKKREIAITTAYLDLAKLNIVVLA